MLQATGYLRKIKFRKKEYRQALDDSIRKIFLTAMRHWLDAVTHAVNNDFPVQSGMAKASLSALAEYLNSSEVKSIGFGKGIAFSIDHDPKKVIPGKKSRGLGRALSKKNNFLVEYKNQYGTFYWKFDWWTNVEHFIQNDQYKQSEELHLINPTPWNSIPAGNIAFQEYLTKNMNRNFPRIQDYIGWAD
jgi:hypothetical protein